MFAGQTQDVKVSFINNTPYHMDVALSFDYVDSSLDTGFNILPLVGVEAG